MRELDECLRLKRRIEELDEKILEIRERALSPKNQIISDMPKGGGGGNPIEEYLIKSEKLEKERSRCKRALEEQWRSITETFKTLGISNTYELLMKYRFYYGLTWRNCTKLIQKDDPDTVWDENRVFRVYSHVSMKLRKSGRTG